VQKLSNASIESGRDVTHCRRRQSDENFRGVDERTLGGIAVGGSGFRQLLVRNQSPSQTLETADELGRRFIGISGTIYVVGIAKEGVGVAG
jgi:hypothetical protein